MIIKRLALLLTMLLGLITACEDDKKEECDCDECPCQMIRDAEVGGEEADQGVEAGNDDAGEQAGDQDASGEEAGEMMAGEEVEDDAEEE